MTAAPVILTKNRRAPYDPRATLRAAQADLDEKTRAYEHATEARRLAAIRAYDIGRLTWTEIGHELGVSRPRAAEIAYPRRKKP